MEEGRALIAAAQEATAQRARQELAALSIPAQCVFTAGEARAALNTDEYFTLMIFLPLSGEGTQLALDAARNTDCAVLLVAREAEMEESGIQKARETGALFLVKPLGREQLARAMESALCIHRRIAYLRQENALLQRKMQELRAVERAKYLLMQTLGMTEPQAHRFIEKQAMDARQSRNDVALRILKTYENT